jgi:hypothetical protein
MITVCSSSHTWDMVSYFMSFLSFFNVFRVLMIDGFL